VHGKVVKTFQVVAVAEALSWTGLIAGMIARSVGMGDGGVPVLGLVHGVLFVCYVVAALVLARLCRWSAGTLVAAAVAAVVPLGSWPFERWALRTGKLDEAGVRRQAGVGLFLQTA